MITAFEPGKVSVPRYIDWLAEHDAARTWVEKPVNDGDLTKGFRPVTFGQLSKAVDRATLWLRGMKGQVEGEAQDQEFPTIAYAGPMDQSYAIIMLAAAKMKWRILVCSLLLDSNAHGHILRLSEAKVYIHSSATAHVVGRALALAPGVAAVETPALAEWLHAEDDSEHPYKTQCPFDDDWDTIKNDPWIIYHSSGSTGLPKLIVYSHLMMTIGQALPAARPAGSRPWTVPLQGLKIYCPVPLNHLLGGVVIISAAIFSESPVIMGPPVPPTPQTVAQILTHSNADCALIPPALIEGLHASAPTRALLYKLHSVSFGGAPLSKSVGDDLQAHGVRIISAFGSTDAGPYYMHFRDDAHWDYTSFVKEQGFEFEPWSPTSSVGESGLAVTGDGKQRELYEMTVVRRPGYEHLQIYFLAHPEARVFRSGDLFEKHHDAGGGEMWRYVGRADDMIVLSSSWKLLAHEIETKVVEKCRQFGVKSALVAGDGRPLPCLILDFGLARDEEESGLLDRVWPAVEAVNAPLLKPVRLSRELVLLVREDKPLIRSAKNEVARKASIALYAQEIDALYASKPAAALAQEAVQAASGRDN